MSLHIEISEWPKMPEVGDRITVKRFDQVIYEMIVSKVYPDGRCDVLSLVEFLTSNLVDNPSMEQSPRLMRE